MAGSERLTRLFGEMARRGDDRAIVEGDAEHSYGDLLAAVAGAELLLDRNGVQPGQVVGLQSDFSLPAIALALAVFRRKATLALLSPSVKDSADRLADISASGLFVIDRGLPPVFHPAQPAPFHPLLDQLKRERLPGFIIFSSGSSGKPKAILHDLNRFLASYERPTKPLTTLAFLLFDHIAGLDTLFYTLHAGGGLVLCNDRSPAAILRLIARWSVEVLPVSPSFLKLMCLSGIPDDLDLTSLRIITYGSEPMDAWTLQRVSELFATVKLRQKYGASEFGAPSAKTREGNGLWVRLDSDRVKVRVEDDVLWLHAPTTMLGYLNADAPAMKDGWICTGDRVEVDGPWLRILGRESDMINVGGEKVFPSEVEAAITELDEVAEVAVSGEPHAILGRAVTALIRPANPDTDHAALRSLVRRHCAKRLDRHKIPTKITITSDVLTNERQKVIRSGARRG